MIYSDLTHIVGYYFPVLTAIFFAIKLVGGESRDRKHSFVLCFLCVLYFMTPDLDESLSEVLYQAAFVEALWIEILISGAGMMIMFAVAAGRFDKTAFKHAVILALIIFFNFMLSWHYTVTSSPFFKSYYDELIITASILQIMVSYNGIRESISRIIGFFGSLQSAVGWAFFACLCWLRNIQEYIKGEKRT